MKENKKNYEKYLKTWLEGIKDEIAFWDNHLKTRGKGYEETFEESIKYEKQFQLENELELVETKFLDVGSGPFSQCGIKTAKTKLTFVAVDPLANIYNFIKEKYDIKTKIVPRFGMVEKLSDTFEEGEFDIVHMSNSLDHSFNPILGIYQLLYVCKIGGKVILRHTENEAERENYKGFHQWNLAIQNDKFVIWRKDEFIDVNEILKDFVEISVSKANDIVNNSNWEHDKIIIRKLKKTPLPLDEDVKSYNEIVFCKLCDLILESYYLK